MSNSKVTQDTACDTEDLFLTRTISFDKGRPVEFVSPELPDALSRNIAVVELVPEDTDKWYHLMFEKVKNNPDGRYIIENDKLFDKLNDKLNDRKR